MPATAAELREFIAQANGPGFALRAAVYEFECGSMLQAFADAKAAGADVEIIYDAVHNASKSQPEDTPRVANDFRSNRKMSGAQPPRYRFQLRKSCDIGI